MVCKPDWVCFFPDDLNCSSTNSNHSVPTDVCNIFDNLNPNHTIPPPSLPNNIDTSLDSCSSADDIFNYINSTNNDDNNPNDSTLSLDCSSANTSDFVYVDESDSDFESRGLNFESLPAHVCNTLPNTKKNKFTLPFSFQRSINYKYPCLVCLSPCKENIQDSICCTLCDEWVHHKCTDLTFEQFKLYCSPDHADDPYYCTNCLYGNCSKQNFENQECFNASEIESFNINDTIHNLCPNSVFRDKEDIQLSEYYTMDELNVEIR